MHLHSCSIHKIRLSTELKAKGYSRPTTAELSEFEELGLLQPCIVSKSSDGDFFELLAREKIWFAAQALGQHEIPVAQVEPKNTTERSRYLTLDENEDPITQATRYRYWLDSGTVRKARELAELEGTTRTTIAHQLRLLKLEPEIQQLIREFRLTSAHGKQLLSASAGQGRVALATRAATQQWSVSKLKNAIGVKKSNTRKTRVAEPDSGKPATPVARTTKDPETRKLETRLTDTLGSPVTIDPEAGTLEINYMKNLDILDGILLKIGYRP